MTGLMRTALASSVVLANDSAPSAQQAGGAASWAMRAFVPSASSTVLPSITSRTKCSTPWYRASSLMREGGFQGVRVDGAGDGGPAVHAPVSRTRTTSQSLRDTVTPIVIELSTTLEGRGPGSIDRSEWTTCAERRS